MTYRDFVEEVKDAAEALVAGAGSRPVTPMLHLKSHDGVYLVAVEPEFFTTVETRRRLVWQYVVPLLQERKADAVAWTFTALERYEPTETQRNVVCVTVIDRERYEVWLASILRAADRTFTAGWRAWAPNEQDGLLLTPIQEALR
jgi:hypothetical protein